MSRFRTRLQGVVSKREQAKAEREANRGPRVVVMWGFCEKHPGGCQECGDPEMCVEYADGTHRWASFMTLPGKPPIGWEEKLEIVAEERQRQGEKTFRTSVKSEV